MGAFSSFSGLGFGESIAVNSISSIILQSIIATFRPLDMVQIFAIRYCQMLASSFISSFRDNWHAGLSVLVDKLKSTHFSNAEFSETQLVEGLLCTGDGYTASVCFRMTGTGKDPIDVRLTLNVRFVNSECLVACDFEDQYKQRSLFEIFNGKVEYTENASEDAEKLIEKFSFEIFEAVNTILGLVGDLPRLESSGIVVRQE